MASRPVQLFPESNQDETKDLQDFVEDVLKENSRLLLLFIKGKGWGLSPLLIANRFLPAILEREGIVKANSPFWFSTTNTKIILLFIAVKNLGNLPTAFDGPKQGNFWVETKDYFTFPVVFYVCWRQYSIFIIPADCGHNTTIYWIKWKVGSIEIWHDCDMTSQPLLKEKRALKSLISLSYLKSPRACATKALLITTVGTTGFVHLFRNRFSIWLW